MPAQNFPNANTPSRLKVKIIIWELNAQSAKTAILLSEKQKGVKFFMDAINSQNATLHYGTSPKTNSAQNATLF